MFNNSSWRVQRASSTHARVVLTSWSCSGKKNERAQFFFLLLFRYSSFNRFKSSAYSNVTVGEFRALRLLVFFDVARCDEIFSFFFFSVIV